MKIGIIGAGRLGLTFALLCEKAGFDVIISDKREEYISEIINRTYSNQEPQVNNLLQNSLKLTATTNNLTIIELCDIIFTFVPTPSNPDGSYNVTNVNEVVKDFFKIVKSNIHNKNKKFVVGCTTNPGDVSNIQKKLSELNVSVAYNPEFIAQGQIVKGLQESDILLIGCDDRALVEILVEIYKKIQVIPVNPHVMSPTAAEITKIGINCFLTTKISYANMIGDILINSNLSDEIDSVLSAIGDDTRIGKKYLNYGFGFGGPCLPRDNRALANYGDKLNLDLKLPKLVDTLNRNHAEFLKNYFKIKNPNKNVPFIMNSVTYKEGSDILEESQQLKLCVDLLEEGYYVFIRENESLIHQLDWLQNKFGDKIKFIGDDCELSGVLIKL